MAWVRLDDQFPDHPKIVAAGPLAGWLHVCALAYSNRQLTDGFIPRGQLRKLVDLDGLAVNHETLVAALTDDSRGEPMWHEVEGGWQIHDYSEYQRSAAEIRQERLDLSAKRAEAGRKGAAVTNAKKQQVEPGKPANESANERQTSGNEADKAGGKGAAPTPTPTPSTTQVVSPTGRDSAGPDQLDDDDDRFLEAVLDARAARFPGATNPAAWRATVARTIDRNRLTRLRLDGYSATEADTQLDRPDSGPLDLDAIAHGTRQPPSEPTGGGDTPNGYVPPGVSPSARCFRGCGGTVADHDPDCMEHPANKPRRITA